MAILAQQPLGALARGGIGQGTQPAPEALSLLASDTFTRKVSQWLIGICGDERCDAHGVRLLLPAGFGGFGALVVTDALTIRKWYKPGMSFAEHAIAAFEAVRQESPDAVLTVHTDTSAQKAAAEAASSDVVECGCAAVAKAGAVLQLLVEQQEAIHPAYREAIVANARELLASGYAQANTARVVEKLASEGLQLEVLDGVHDGVALIRNKRRGTVIDRAALYKACADAGVAKLAAFEYDEWAMHEAADRLSDDPAFFKAGGDALMMTTIRAIASPDLTVITYE